MNSLAQLMVLLHQILFNLAIAVIAEAILTQISAELMPALHGVAHMLWVMYAMVLFIPGPLASSGIR